MVQKLRRGQVRPSLSGHYYLKLQKFTEKRSFSSMSQASAYLLAYALDRLTNKLDSEENS